MSDLPSRLRTEPFMHWELRHEAADRIAELETKVKRLCQEMIDAQMHTCTTIFGKSYSEWAELEAENAKLRAVYEAAKGLSFGEDWNNGTHASIYRPKLLKVIAALEDSDD